MIQIIPAIDIIGGRCVRLSQGDYGRRKVYDALPWEMAKAFADSGVRRIHVVDLDGAKESKPLNLNVLERIASNVDVEIEWGGGIADRQALDSVFAAGATQAVVGTVAALQPSLFESWLCHFGPERMVLGADVKNGLVAVKGWLETAPLTLEALLERFLRLGLSQAIVTDVGRDGMLQGPDCGFYCSLQSRFPSVDITVSGGVGCMDDIRDLDAAGLRKVIVGKALYEHRITLDEIGAFLR